MTIDVWTPKLERGVTDISGYCPPTVKSGWFWLEIVEGAEDVERVDVYSQSAPEVSIFSPQPRYIPLGDGFPSRLYMRVIQGGRTYHLRFWSVNPIGG